MSQQPRSFSQEVDADSLRASKSVIETREEMNAEQAAWMDEGHDIDNACELERKAFRIGWVAGRDWARRESGAMSAPRKD